MSKRIMLAVVASLATAMLHYSVGGVQNQNRPFNVMETTIEDVHNAYKAGTLTAHQLVQAYLDRINAFDKKGPTINCIISLNPQALAEADRLDAAFKRSGLVGPLHGIPVLVKDEIDTAGMPTTQGTLVFKDYRPPRDAFVIDRLKKAGAIILGKTTLSEYAGGDTFGSMFGVSRNPYDLERTVGGSSGGSGGALTANFSTVAIGEETFASIRRPGAWNAVVSMRPTPGLVSRSGMWDGYPSPTAQMGPMARTVRDLARLLDAMVGYDPEDPVTALGVGRAPESYARVLDSNGLKGARIGVLRESIGVATEPDSDDFKKVDVVFQKNIAELKAAGADCRRSDRHPEPQGAPCKAREQSGDRRRGAAAVPGAQSEFSVQDPRGHREVAGASPRASRRAKRHSGPIRLRRPTLRGGASTCRRGKN